LKSNQIFKISQQQYPNVSTKIICLYPRVIFSIMINLKIGRLSKLDILSDSQRQKMLRVYRSGSGWKRDRSCGLLFSKYILINIINVTHRL